MAVLLRVVLVWFDKIQLEKGEVSSSFNPIENSSLENMTEKGCIPGWIRGDGTSCDPKMFLSKRALQDIHLLY